MYWGSNLLSIFIILQDYGQNIIDPDESLWTGELLKARTLQLFAALKRRSPRLVSDSSKHSHWHLLMKFVLVTLNNHALPHFHLIRSYYDLEILYVLSN